MARVPRTAARRIIATTALLLALPAPAQQATTPTAGLIRPGDAPQLSLIYSGDVIGYLDPCG